MDQAVNLDILARLHRLHTSGRLAHAYLFAGPRGVGKFATALALARRVNCLDGGVRNDCGCASCRKISAGNHPDILVLQKLEDKTVILIDQVRSLIERLEFRAMEAKVKFALVRDADQMNAEAANAFLKTLEEPRPATVLILMTALPQALLPTIRSRCQVERFPALAPEVLARRLQAQHGMTADDAAVLAAFSQGSPGRALELGEDFINRRRLILDAFWGAGSSEDFIKQFAAGSDSGSSRDSARDVLMVVAMALRDALMLKTGAPHLVANRDRQVELRRLAEKYTARQLQERVGRVTDAIRRLDGNQNVKLVLTVVREVF